MKGDFSRVTFRKEKAYSRVQMQQGRVQVDADWNEQQDIHAHLQRTESTDVIGASGVPAFENTGFMIAWEGSQGAGNDQLLQAGGLTIGAGRIYVNGILVENSEPVGYDEQPNLTLRALPTEDGLYLFYLDVWERHVTSLEDESLREVALGGPDTTTRVQTAWRVDWLRIGQGEQFETGRRWCWDRPAEWYELTHPNRGMMKARAQPALESNDPCIVPATAGYRSLENQLYRVEIHEPATDGKRATFKWSRDNGTVVARVTGLVGPVLTVSTTRRDHVQAFASAQWVEITDDNRVNRKQPGVFAQIQEVAEERIKVVDGSGLGDFDPRTSVVTIRRWDGLTEPVELPPSDNQWLPLEHGVEICFKEGRTYESGDYWLVPARTVTGQVEWERDDAGEPGLMLPHGPQHHFCRLAVAQVYEGEVTVHDCRQFFAPLSHAELVYASGDGQEAMPNKRLPQALRVRVYNGDTPLSDAWVLFRIAAGQGGLLPVLNAEHRTTHVVLKEDGTVMHPRGSVVGDPDGPSATRYNALVVPTDAEGFAQCTWTLEMVAEPTLEDEERLLPDQRVHAILVRWEEQAETLPIRLEQGRTIAFAASFGVAWRTRYGGSQFPDQQHPSLEVEHVEDALDQLRENVKLAYVSGDGQEARRGEMLPQPLQVRVANGQWPYAGATVRFTIAEQGQGGGDNEDGGSLLASEDADPDPENLWTLEVSTDTEGLAQCWWLPRSIGWSQRVEAVLVEPRQIAGRSEANGPVFFNARLSVAEEVTYDGSPFPDSQHSDLVVTTVERALDQLRENVVLSYLSGQGQVAPRSTPLAEPLRVRVGNGHWPYAGAQVRFEIVTGGGGLSETPFIDQGDGDPPSSGGGDGDVPPPNDGDGDNNPLPPSGPTELQVTTDSQGLAECWWFPTDTITFQSVRATLLSPSGPTVAPVEFEAQLNIAEEVTYDGHPFPDSQHDGLRVNTVEDALDQMRANAALAYVGGDGQETRSGQAMPRPLQVRVANGHWPYQGATVRFSIVDDGGGGVDPEAGGFLTPDGGTGGDKTLQVATNAEGLAECWWTPSPGSGPQWSQRVEAVLLAPDALAGTLGSRPVVFNGRLGLAEEVSYTPPEDMDPSMQTVQAGLDELNRTKVNRSGDTINGSLEVTENVTVQGNLTVNGETTTVNTATLQVEDNIVSVNRYDPGAGTPPTTAGLEVYRGGSAPAQVLWSEVDRRWKMGIDGALGNVGYGPDWEALTDGSVVDGLHRHRKLYPSAEAQTPAVSVDNTGNVGVGTEDPKTQLHVVGNLRLESGAELELLGDPQYYDAEQAGRLLRLRGTETSRGGRVAGGLAVEGFTDADQRRKHLLTVRGTGDVGIATKSPKARLHVISVDEPLLAVSWSAGNDFDDAEQLFEEIAFGATRLTIVGGEGRSFAHSHNVDTVDIFIDLLDAGTGQWVEKFTTRIDPGGEFSLDGLAVNFASQHVGGVRFRSQPAQQQTFHAWTGTTLSFDAIAPPAAVFEGQNVGVGTTNPSERLTVQGSLKLEQAGSAVPMLKLDGQPGKTVPSVRTYNPDSEDAPYVWWAARDERLLSVESASQDGVAGTSRFVVSSNGQVGVGISSPEAPLDIAAGASGERRVLTGTDKSLGETGLHGTEFAWNTDALFVGLKDEGPDRKDAVIQFGDNTNDVLKVQAKLTGGQAAQEIVEFRPSGEMLGKGTRGFTTPYPEYPDGEIVHASLDGPEHAVFYRGEAQLTDGRCEIVLPQYFEDLTHTTGRTVQLTAKGQEPFVLSYTDIENGRFTVHGTSASGWFSWEVKAVRKDLTELVVIRNVPM